MKTCWDSGDYDTADYARDFIHEDLQKMLNKMLEDGYSYDAFFILYFLKLNIYYLLAYYLINFIRQWR